LDRAPPRHVMKMSVRPGPRRTRAFLLSENDQKLLCMGRNFTVAHPYLLNSFQAIAPLTAHEKGVHFLGEHISLKNLPQRVLLRRSRSSFKGTCLLIWKKKQRLLCMGRTFTANKPLPLNNCPKQLSVSWESNTARVKASRKKIFSLNTYNIWWCIRMTVTPSNGLVGTPDFFSGITMSSIQTIVVKLCFNKALLLHSMMLWRFSFFCFFLSRIFY
jgi:hypothetical protein